MKNILVPIDFSDESENALKFAAEIARASGSKLHILHIIEVVLSPAFDPMGGAETAMNDSDTLKEYVDQINKRYRQIINHEHFQGLDIETHVQAGKPFKSISKQITGLNADLVVMGSRGVGKMEDIMIGSNAEKTVRYAHCPVITVCEPVSLNHLNEIVLAYSFYDHLPESTSGLIQLILRESGASLDILWVNTPHLIKNEDEAEQQMKEFVDKNGLGDAELKIQRGFLVEQEIVKYAHQNKAGLLIMGTHQRKGLSHILFRSVAEDVIKQASISALTFHI